MVDRVIVIKSNDTTCCCLEEIKDEEKKETSANILLPRGSMTKQQYPGEQLTYGSRSRYLYFSDVAKNNKQNKNKQRNNFIIIPIKFYLYNKCTSKPLRYVNITCMPFYCSCLYRNFTYRTLMLSVMRKKRLNILRTRTT